MIILHGYGSTGETSSTCQLVKDTFNNVLTPTYKIQNPASKTANQLLKLPTNEVIVGISFGGFIARWLANNTQAKKLVLLNPVINHNVTLQRHLGKKDNTGFVLTEKHISDYDYFKVISDKPNLKISILLGMNDEIIDNSLTYKYFQNTANIKTINTDHRFTHHKKELLEFIKNETQS